MSPTKSRTSPPAQWAKPTPISDLELAFPAHALDLMPPRDECEAALKAMSDGGKKWRDLQFQWFYHGLPADVKFHMQPEIDGDAAVRHLSAIQGSFAPKHEHKEAAVAYLASLWFTKVTGLKR